MRNLFKYIILQTVICTLYSNGYCSDKPSTNIKNNEIYNTINVINNNNENDNTINVMNDNNEDYNTINNTDNNDNNKNKINMSEANNNNDTNKVHIKGIKNIFTNELSDITLSSLKDYLKEKLEIINIKQNLNNTSSKTMLQKNNNIIECIININDIELAQLLYGKDNVSIELTKLLEDFINVLKYTTELCNNMKSNDNNKSKMIAYIPRYINLVSEIISATNGAIVACKDYDNTFRIIPLLNKNCVRYLYDEITKFANGNEYKINQLLDKFEKNNNCIIKEFESELEEINEIIAQNTEQNKDFIKIISYCKSVLYNTREKYKKLNNNNVIKLINESSKNDNMKLLYINESKTLTKYLHYKIGKKVYLTELLNIAKDLSDMMRANITDGLNEFINFIKNNKDISDIKNKINMTADNYHKCIIKIFSIMGKKFPKLYENTKFQHLIRALYTFKDFLKDTLNDCFNNKQFLDLVKESHDIKRIFYLKKKSDNIKYILLYLFSVDKKFHNIKCILNLAEKYNDITYNIISTLLIQVFMEENSHSNSKEILDTIMLLHDNNAINVGLFSSNENKKNTQYIIQPTYKFHEFCNLSHEKLANISEKCNSSLQTLLDKHKEFLSFFENMYNSIDKGALIHKNIMTLSLNNKEIKGIMIEYKKLLIDCLENLYKILKYYKRQNTMKEIEDYLNQTKNI